MLKKALFAIVRWTIFLVAAITAVVLTFATMGVVVTMFKWSTESETAAVILMAALCGALAGLVSVWKRRTTKDSPTRPHGKAFAGWAIGLSALVVVIGWMMSRFHVTSPLTVICLRPFGGVSAPLLVSALEDSEASRDASERLTQFPDAALRQLPRLETIIREDRKIAIRDAILIIAGLGPKAAAAASTLVERARSDVAKNWSPTDYDFYDRSPYTETAQAWGALIEVGPPAVPAIIEGLKSSHDFRERLVLSSVLRHIGKEIEPAVPVLIGILTDPTEGDSKEECTKRVLWTLGTMGPAAESAVPIITPWALDPHYSPVFRSAITTLGDIGNEKNGAVQTLLQIIEDPDWGHSSSEHSRQRLAVVALGQIGRDAAPAIPRLLELIDSEKTREYLEQGYWSEQTAAGAEALAKIGPTGLQEVVKLLSGPYAKYAIEAIEKAGPIARDAVPALHDALLKAGPAQRVRLAMAIERVEGPSAAIVGVMAGYFDLSDQDQAAVGYVQPDLIERFEQLGSQAQAAVPTLTRLVSQPGRSDRWRTVRALWNIDRTASALLPAVLEMLNDESANVWDGLDPNWLVERDPNGEQVIPALTEVVAKSDRTDTYAVQVLLLYGKRARPALPAVLAASAAERFGGGLTVEFLWGLSAWDVVRYSFYSYEGTVVAIFIFCGACLIVECVLRLRRRMMSPSAPQHVT